MCVHLALAHTLQTLELVDWVNSAKAQRDPPAQLAPLVANVPADVIAYRCRVIRVFLQSGTPLHRLDTFRSLLEENGLRLTEHTHIRDYIPPLLHFEKDRMQKELLDVDVGVYFDGCTKLTEVEAVVVRYVTGDWRLQQKLVRLAFVQSSLDADETAAFLATLLTSRDGLNLSPRNIVSAAYDRAAVNLKAFKTLKAAIPSIVGVGCFSHTLDNAGGECGWL
jgi:hypothetical protein